VSVQEQQMLRKELNVKPFVPKSSLTKPHHIERVVEAIRKTKWDLIFPGARR